MTVSQVFYSRWGTETSSHPGYFDDIDRIAQWIAWGLEAQMTGFSLSTYQMSTIAVHQHKEKFGTVRVYCTLASRSKVDRQWRAHLASWRKKGEGEGVPRPSKKKFAEDCLSRDMRWYRSVYKSAIASWPHYEAAIRKCADSDLLLMDEADLERAVLSGQITKVQSDAYFAIIREIP